MPKIPLPDGNKPIKIGDSSFIYKGVYHPIHWYGNQPYRPRVETLVIKDGNELFLRLKDTKKPSIQPYRIPGGSIDADSTLLGQAEAETHEEALISITGTYPTGIQYYERYEEGFLKRGGDMPIEYTGSYSDIFIAKYTGSYDKSKIEEKDLDDDMANNGKFYPIKDIAKYLREEHTLALLQSPYIDKESLYHLNLTRANIVTESENPGVVRIPNDRLYHGSTVKFDTFKPMSLDLGNIYQEPGWSTFCFNNIEDAKLFALSKAFTDLLCYHPMKDYDKYKDELLVKYINHSLYTSNNCFSYIMDNNLIEAHVKIYVYVIDSSKLNVGIGNDPSLDEYTFRESNVKPLEIIPYELSIMDMKDDIEVVEDIIQFEKDNTPKDAEFAWLKNHNYQTEIKVRDALIQAIGDGLLSPGDDVEDFMYKQGLSFDSEDICIPSMTIALDDPVLEETYPLEIYGLPNRKAYPMPDEKHVRSAIKFFNYADKEDREELARNINAKIKEYHIKDIKVGKNNDFKDYYKPIYEYYTLDQYMVAFEHCKSKLSEGSTEVVDKIKAISQLIVEHFEAFKIKNIQPVIEATNLMSDNIVVGAREFSKAIMEAEDNDDDVEDAQDGEDTPEDYTQGADEEPEDYTAGVDDGEEPADDTPEDEPEPEEDTPEEPEDYTQGADEEPEGDAPEGDDTGEDGAGDDMPAMGGEGGTEDAEDYTDGADTADDSTTNDTSTEDTGADSENSDENTKRYDNKELKNYFLLQNFIEVHEVILDVSDSLSGVILPTPDANKILKQVVQNMQKIQTFTESFIQFQFSNVDYAFNLYYYNIITNALKMNLNMLEIAISGSDIKNTKKEKEDS